MLPTLTGVHSWLVAVWLPGIHKVRSEIFDGAGYRAAAPTGVHEVSEVEVTVKLPLYSCTSWFLLARDSVPRKSWSGFEIQQLVRSLQAANLT
jgi:hypothetical protein